jgi:hypothetical protein
MNEQYEILPYTKKIAKKMGVSVQPSTLRNYKIDVFNSKNGEYITSCGDKRYLDYPYYLLLFGQEKADERRRLYKIRHDKYRNIPNSRSFFADKLLW